MEITFTRKIPHFLAILFFGMLLFVASPSAFAQVQTVYIDLTGQPNGYKETQLVKRDGNACGGSNCIQIIVTLDKDAAQMELTVPRGAESGGSMFYTVDCGTQTYPVGQLMCIPRTGSNTITLTICKPGNNTNVYAITSLAAFEPMSDVSVIGGCSKQLFAPATFLEGSIRWVDISGRGYEKYLSDVTSARPFVTPDDAAPAYVDYRVNGMVRPSECATNSSHYDEVRVHFLPKPVVSIGPDPAIICPGGSTATLTGSVTGGDGEFDYYWYDPSNTLVGRNLTYNAITVGMHKFVAVPKNAANCQEFSSTTNVVTNLTANAGPDQLACASGTVQLAGAITAATGGVWSTSGSGTFSSNTNLNAVYTPSAADISAGSVRLTLTSTGNGNCSPVSDQMLVTFYNMQVVLNGTPVICNGTRGTVSANVTGAQGTVSYLWSNGATTSTINNLTAGTYTVTATDSRGCAITRSLTITEVTGPADFTATATNASCGSSNGRIVVGGVTQGTAPYTYSKDGVNFQTSATFSGLAPGSHTITVKDANGCTVAKSFTLTNIPGPTAVAVSSGPASCANNDGSITAGTVTGGTSPYQYSINGTTFQAGTTFTGLASGSYTLTARDASGCIVTAAVTVAQASITNFTATPASSTCGNPNGTVAISGVVGGIGTLEYSKDGQSYQASATLTGFAAGTHTVWVRDSKGCVFSKSVTVQNIPGPTNFTATPTSSTCGNSNGQIVVSNVVTSGSTTYTYSINGGAYQPSNTFTGLAANTYTIAVRDANGCTFSKSVVVTNVAGPTAVAATSTAASCANNDGSITAGTVTGGTSPYQYSINGTTFQAGTTFTGLASGSYTLTARDANGCSTTATVSIIQNIPTNFTVTPTASTCGNSNGSVVVSDVVGGFAPYTYSKNGTTFQTSATLTNMAAGSHTITVRDAKGCTFAKTVTITNIPGPSNVNLTANASTCGASNGSIVVGTVTNGTAPYTYSKDGTNFQPGTTFGALAEGTYTITVKDANGCTFAKQVAVTNTAGPTDFTASLQQTTCGAANGEITVTGRTGGTSPYTYSKDGVNFQTSATFTGLAVGSHTITVKDANGCIIAKSFTLTNIAGPTAVTATSAAASCANNDGSITAGAVTGGTSPYQYSINGTTFQTGTTFTGLASGSYTLTARDANGCTVTRTVNVTKNIPTTFATTTAASTCGSNNGSITVGTVTGGFSPYTYSKDGVNFQTSATLTGFVAGTHSITVKDAKGCTITRQVVVSDVAGPSDLTASATSSTCGNPNGQLTVTNVSGGVEPYTYSINGSAFQATATFTGLAEGTHRITVRDANGCTFAEDVAVSNIAGPNFSATAQSSTCGASNGRINVSEVNGGTTPYLYSINGGTFQTGTSFTGLAAGTYTIAVKDANGCTATRDVEVTDVAGPNGLTLANTSTTCGSANGTVTVSNVAGGTAPYQYSINGGSFQSGTSFASLAAGTHTIMVRDANGCTFSKETTVEDIAGPSDLTATAKASTCGAANGEITVTGVTGGTSGYTYSKDGVNFQSGTTLTGFAAGTHTITVRDANGCTFTKSVTVTNTGGPTAVAAASTPASCADNDGSITAGAVTGGTAPYQYSINGTTFQAGTTFTGLASGSYTLTARDANGCTVTRTVTIGENVPSNFVHSTVPSTCGRSDGSIKVESVAGGTAPYTYRVNNGSFQSGTTFSGLAAGAHRITVRDAKGCEFTKSVTLENVEGPQFSASTTGTTCGNNNGRITVGAVTGGVAPYTYSIDGTNFQTATQFTNVLAGEYAISVKDANGCIGTVTVEVQDVAGPSDFTLAGTSSTCGNSNASIRISDVVGGTAPFTYSKDGSNFQTSANFGSLAAGQYTITVKDANGCLIAKTIDVADIPGPSELTLASTSSTCGSANGVITVSGVTGGTAGYTYSINGGSFQSGTRFESVLAGKYTVTVRDANGCTLSREITVEDIAGPSDLTATAKASTCGAANGELTITGTTGGTAPYSYSKDGVNFQTEKTLTGFAAGTHKITVKDVNGCTFEKTFTVTDIAGPTAVAATSAAASCNDNDGSITAGAVTGGTAPYQYSINGTTFQAGTSFTGLASGSYTLTVRDANGCTTTRTVTINKNIPTTFAATTTASTCSSNNGTITVGEVTGGFAPYTYSRDGVNFQASATLTGFVAGTHSITIKDAKGCTYTAQVQVSDIAGPSELAIAPRASTCGDPNASFNINGVTGGMAPYTYSIDGTNFQSATAFASLTAGDYQVTVKDANGCTYTQAVRLENIPGPSALVATVQSTSCGRANGSITVASVEQGTAPYTYSKDGVNFQTSATLTGLLAGEHTITVKDANGCTIAKVVTIEDVAGPGEMTLTSTASTCGSANGTISVTGVTGGTAGYTYSLNGGNFQSSTRFESILAGKHTLTVRDANGCTLSREITVTDIAGPADLIASAKASTCGAANGELTITGTTGGTAPYTFSLDGTNFQAAATFTGLLAGNHKVTVKDANGCTFEKNFTITDIAGPTALAASAQAATCADNDGRITAGTVSGGTAPYQYSLNGGAFQSGTSFTALASGEYTLTVRDANGCETTTTVKVDKEGPGSFVAVANSSTCGSDNGSIRVTSVNGGVAPYTYSLNGGAFQSGASFSSLMAGAYTITVKDANNCTHTETITITNVAGPSDFTAAAQNTTCGNSNGQISVSNVAGGMAPYTYSINSTSFQSSASFNNLAAGEYLVTVKDANGCTFAKAVTVTNTDGPAGFATTVKASTCGASNGSVTVGTVTGGRAPYTYSKDGSNFQTSAELTGMAAGNHTVYIKDANGCVFSKAVIIENIAGPTTFALAATAATCGQANGSITASGVTGGTAPYTYSLNGGAFQSQASFTAVAAGEYNITVRDANGCTIEKKVVVDNVAGPSALTANTTAASCDANDGTITVGQVTGGTAPYTYSINGTSFQASGAFSGLAPGTYELTVKDANGCSTANTVTVGQKGPREATLSANKASCGETNGSITVTAVIGGTAPYTYSLNGGSFQSAATFANLAAGVYTVVVRDAEGCSITVEQAVSNNGGVESFTATGTDASCGERNGRIAISAIVGGTAPYTYSINGTNFVSEPTFTGLAEGEYQVMVKDASGCVQVKTVTLQNSPMLTDAKFTVSAATCGDAAGEVVVTSVTGGTAPYAYSLDGTNFSANATMTGVKAGSYTLTVKDAKGCTFSLPVQVNGLSSALDYVQHITCKGETNGKIAIKATGADANTEYSIDNGKTFQKNPVFSNLAGGNYQVVTRFSSSCSIAVGTVKVEEPAVLQLTVDVTDGQPGKPNSGSARALATGGTAPYTYFLNNGPGVSESEFKELKSDRYTIRVQDANGCSVSAEFYVENPGEVDIPTGFTPNGDGRNDTWEIENLHELYPNCRVTVFNRWGSPVFESNGYAKPWDGTHNGKRLPDATYYAIIEFGDDRAPVKTAVTIMR